VEAIKMRIGCCQRCQRKVTPEILCCFDFNHLDPETKRDNIAKMVSRYSLTDFFKYIDPEIQLCRLECANCHWKYTQMQMKEITAKVSALAHKSKMNRCPSPASVASHLGSSLVRRTFLPM
jgi:hypothetical protein